MNWLRTLMIALGLFPVAAFGDINLDVKAYTLKNGMKILVQEDHSIPSVAMYIFYRIGSRNEHPGATGISHFFEHMMFNGAKKYGPHKFDTVMEAAGGSNNAYTERDVTVYIDWFPMTMLELIFDLEADRIEHLSFDPKLIESERGVVASERRLSVENDNFGLLDEQLWATSFVAHPYQWPVVGWMSDVENWKIEDLKRHFETGYSPSNATIVVVGDVVAEEILKLAQKYIEPIPSRPAPRQITTVEPDQTGERRLTVKKFAQLPILMIGYHVPESTNPDSYVLDVLQMILFSGQSSRMYQRIVDKDQLALFIYGGSDIAFNPTLFTITAQLKSGVTPEVLEKAVYEEIDKIKAEPVSDQELEKAKSMLLADFYSRIKTISGRANTLGQYEVFFGDYHKLFSAPENYDKVTTEDVRRIVRKYFTDKNRTVATLVPEG